MAFISVSDYKFVQFVLGMGCTEERILPAIAKSHVHFEVHGYKNAIFQFIDTAVNLSACPSRIIPLS